MGDCSPRLTVAAGGENLAETAVRSDLLPTPIDGDLSGRAIPVGIPPDSMPTVETDAIERLVEVI
jgi:hypothetical protein